MMLFSLCPVWAQTELTVNPASGDNIDWGTGKMESYDIAFLLPGETLAGKTITKVRVPLPDEGVAGCSIWLSSSLQLSGGKNKADIVTVESEISDGWIEATFPEAYTVTENGVYIGYSFTVSAINDKTSHPVRVSETDGICPMYVHSSRKYLRWDTYGLNISPFIEVTLAGDFHDNDVSIESQSEVGALYGEEGVVTLILRNHGKDAVESIDINLDMGMGESRTEHLEFTPSLATAYFRNVTIGVDIHVPQQPGAYTLKIAADKVNGEENMSAMGKSESGVYSYPSQPERLPLMEEYTGVWCGWCPRGIEGMARMTKLYPEKFICAVYHREDDPMTTIETLATPYNGAPSGFLDRLIAVDPYSGLLATTPATAAEGIGQAWLQAAEMPTTAYIDVAAKWRDEEKKIIDIESNVEFIRQYLHSPFAVAFILTANGLHDGASQWNQSNYFSGNEQYLDTELAGWVAQPAKIRNQIYDDVVVMATDLTGIPESLPLKVEMSEPMEVNHSFNIDEAVNLKGESLPIDKEKLKVIAVVVNKVTGRVENCCATQVKDLSGIDIMEADNAPEITISDGKLHICGIEDGVPVRIHTVDGMTLYSGIARDTLSVELGDRTGSVYIIRIGEKSFKIVK